MSPANALQGAPRNRVQMRRHVCLVVAARLLRIRHQGAATPLDERHQLLDNSGLDARPAAA